MNTVSPTNEIDAVLETAALASSAPETPETEAAEPEALAADGPRAVTSRGIKIALDTRFISGPLRRALRQDRYEELLSLAAQRAVTAEDRVLELGGGFGYLSTLLARKQKPARLTVVEAEPDLIPVLQATHALNGVDDVTVVSGVLGTKPGKATLYRAAGGLGATLVAPAAEKDGVEVEVHDAAGVMADAAPTVLICDINGAEAELIPELDLSGLQTAIVRLYPRKSGGASVASVFNAMHGAGLIYYPRLSREKLVTFRRIP